MESNNDEYEFKVEMDALKSICRCCLSTGKRMSRIDSYRELFIYLADIFISDSNGLPQFICYECSALLAKCVKFKQKVLRADTLLFEYHNRCVPFLIEGKDSELSKYSSPLLTLSNILVIDTSSSENGFHQVLEHEKQLVLCKRDDEDVQDETNFDDDVSIKNEMSDDDVSLLEVRNNKLNEEVEDIKEEKKRIVKKKINSKRKIIHEQTDLNPASDKEPKRTPRKPKEIDENKIRIITLDPIEQLKQREKESKEIKKFLFPCHLCYRGFNYEVKLKNHMFKHNPARGAYKCELCSTYFPTAQYATNHSLTHTRSYECVQCGRRMLDKVAVVNHYRSQHEGVLAVFTCHICGKVSNNNRTHRGHMRNHHSGPRVKCEECGKSFLNKDILVEHQTIHQGIKNYECEKCGKKFGKPQSVKIHMTKHNDSKDYYCVECDVRFKTALNLKLHLTRSSKHIDKEALKFECASCCKRFDTSAVLETHIRVQHEGVREYRCNLCDLALASQATLKNHVRYKHDGVRPPLSYVCQTCGKMFRGKSTLVNHVRTHTGEKPFECPTCGRAFAQRAAMKTHIKLVHLKIHRTVKKKPNLPSPEASPKSVIYKKESPLTFEWNSQSDDEYLELLPNTSPVPPSAQPAAPKQPKMIPKPLHGVKRTPARRLLTRKP